MKPFESPDTTWADDRLVQACLNGDQAAWEALIHKYQRLIYAIPFRYGASHDEASDIFQAVCIELYAELPKLRKLESLRYFLMTVSARQSLKAKTSRIKHSGVELDGVEQPDPAALAGPEWLAGLERSQMVAEALNKVSERCQQLIRRLFFEDPPLPYDVLARQLGLATGSIGFNRGRCLDKLRKELEGVGL
jgi:RNA polymerase sigma factor (sigma-70 family)